LAVNNNNNNDNNYRQTGCSVIPPPYTGRVRWRERVARPPIRRRPTVLRLDAIPDPAADAVECRLDVIYCAMCVLRIRPGEGFFFLFACRRGWGNYIYRCTRSIAASRRPARVEGECDGDIIQR